MQELTTWPRWPRPTSPREPGTAITIIPPFRLCAVVRNPPTMTLPARPLGPSRLVPTVVSLCNDSASFTRTPSLFIVAGRLLNAARSGGGPSAHSMWPPAQRRASLRGFREPSCPQEDSINSRRVSVADSSSGTSLNSRPKTASPAQHTTALGI
jgi:hypothetical protein